MARKAKKDRIHPEWPHREDGDHPVSEFLADRQGALSPFGEITFPQEKVHYEHPVTKINR